MKLELRTERRKDFETVEKVIAAAFEKLEISDQTEHHLVKRLRTSASFIPELSIVAEVDGNIVGHILLTKIMIRNDQKTIASLALAPVSVKPEFQNKGIGSQLILESHNRARAFGFKSIILVGHAEYYPRFGYELTKNYDIQLPFPAADENCMVIQLFPNALKGVNGKVEYPKAFFE